MPSIHGTSEAPASLVPGYEILQTLSEGGMGKVYLARQDALNRLVCVKVMSIPAGEDPDICRSRFCREAELLASVSHPHILSIFNFGTTAEDGLPFLVTEYIEAGDLRRRMRAGEPTPLSQIRSIVLQIGDALTFLHGKGILHRDLKPENILMPTDSLVKVGDFGIAVMQDKAGLLTQSVRGMGTVGYMSPEQQYGLKVDERTDEYSLAALCYELLTGKRPLGLFPPPSQLNSQLTPELDSVVLRALAEEPKTRFQSVQEFVKAFEQALAASPKKARLLPAALVGVCAILVAAAALGFAWFVRHQSEHNVPTAPGRPPIGSVVIPGSADPGVVSAGKAVETGETTLKQSPEFKKLVELRAYVIWHERGRPEGEEEKNWMEAEREMWDRVNDRAFELWKKQGRPTEAAGEAVRDQNMRDAIDQLHKAMDDDLRRNPID
jgi:hypothetical protein